MEADVTRRLEAARGALERSDWPAAQAAFEAVLDGRESGDARESGAAPFRLGEALFGLGEALFWQGETEPALRAWERAYVSFRRAADHEQAVLAAVYLCLAYRMSMGNDAASRGWLGRASSLVEEHRLALDGWVLLCRAHLAIDDGQPQAGEAWARESLEIARRTGDGDLQLCAMSELGAALVELGRHEEGAAVLDETMAAALAGEGHDLDAVVMISCRTIAACSRAGDLKRATQWIRAAEDFNRRHGSPHLYTTCRTQYGGILFATGSWQEAERELRDALRIGRAAEPLLHVEALAKLAELRLAQVGPDDATSLLAGYGEHPSATLAVASVHLARGEPALAESLLRRRLHALDEGTMEAAALNELLAEAQVAQGNTENARALAVRLIESSTRMASGIVRARAERALGRAMMAGTTEIAGTNKQGAVEHLERALAAFVSNEMPLEVARTRMLLATALAGAQRDVAIREARAALDAFEHLGAARDADAAAALLRSLGARAARSAPRAVGALTRRELEVLALLGEGLSNRDIADRLFITRKTVEHHVASVLAKTGLSGRGAAAAYAVRHLDRGSAPGSATN